MKDVVGTHVKVTIAHNLMCRPIPSPSTPAHSLACPCWRSSVPRGPAQLCWRAVAQTDLQPAGRVDRAMIRVACGIAGLDESELRALGACAPAKHLAV